MNRRAESKQMERASVEDLKNVFMKALNLLKTQHQAEWEEVRRAIRRQLDNKFA